MQDDKGGVWVKINIELNCSAIMFDTDDCLEMIENAQDRGLALVKWVIPRAHWRALTRQTAVLSAIISTGTMPKLLGLPFDIAEVGCDVVLVCEG